VKLLKVLGLIALGVGVIAVAGIVLGLVAWVMHIIVPLAVLFAVGWVAYQVFFSGGSKDAKTEPKKLEEKSAETNAAAAPERKGLSAEEAAKLFDEHRKKLSE